MVTATEVIYDLLEQVDEEGKASFLGLQIEVGEKNPYRYTVNGEETDFQDACAYVQEQIMEERKAGAPLTGVAKYLKERSKNGAN